MNKIDFIKDFASKSNGWQRQALIPALVSCLTPIEAVKALEPMSLNEPLLRNVLLTKVTRDIQNGGYQPYHITLVNNLISSFHSLPSNKKQICGYFLSSLYSYLPSDLQRQIIKFFITSSYTTMRNRAYKILSQIWNSEFKPIIIQSWKKYHEYYCARLILKNFPDRFITKHFDDLEKDLEGKIGFPLLYIRAARGNPNLLQRLGKQDGITLAYVMLKLGKSLTQKRAIKIFNDCKFDQRIGLYLWCLGRMKLWGMLENIAVNSQHLQQEELAWLRNKYNIR